VKNEHGHFMATFVDVYGFSEVSEPKADMATIIHTHCCVAMGSALGPLKTSARGS